MKYLSNQPNIKSVFTLFSIFILFALVSCGPAKNDSQQTPQVPVIPQNQEQPSVVNPETTTTDTTELTNQVPSEESNTEVTINPRHGEPGHRCDIPVGAPLNSPPVNTVNQAPANPPTPTAPSIANNPTAPTLENARRLNSSQPRSTTPTQNSGKINPPHGQPGHRCDIAVGSPLP